MAVNEWVPMDTDDYTVGQITLTAGSSDVTFTNAFNGAESSFYAGDSIYVPTAGKWLLLASITSRTAGTLLYPCPADCAGTFDLRLRPLSRNARQAGLAAMVLRNLQVGNLPALADLTLAPGQVPVAGQVQGSFVAGDLPTAPDLSPYMKIETYDKNGKKTDVYDAGNHVENITAHNNKGALILTNAERSILTNFEDTLKALEVRTRVPVGVEGWTESTTPPSGFLAANGGLYNVATYPNLAKFFGTKFGGDGVNTFGVPDRRGLVPRGWDNGRGLDPGRELGSYQGDAIRNITGSIGSAGGAAFAANASGALSLSGSVPYITNVREFSGYFPTLSFNASSMVPTAAENRMKSFAVLFIIKY